MSIFGAKKLLIIANGNLSAAHYALLVALISVLTRNEIRTDLVGTSTVREDYTKAIGLPEVNQIAAIAARKFVLTFDKGTESVRNVQWQQSDEQLSLHVELEHGHFTPGEPKVEITGADYDTIVYYNIDNFAELTPIFSEFPSIVDEVKHISIGKQLEITDQQVEAIIPTEQSLTEFLYDHIKGQGTVAEDYTLVLAALILETERFTRLSSAKTFSYMAEMINNGANLEDANKIVASFNTLENTPSDAPTSDSAIDPTLSPSDSIQDAN